MSTNGASQQPGDNKPTQNLVAPWKKGQTPNPAGRPKGSRHKITERFLKKLAADFKVHGEKAIETVREKHPDRYLTIVASCMPKDYNIDLNVTNAPRLIADLRGFDPDGEAEDAPIDVELLEHDGV